MVNLEGIDVESSLAEMEEREKRINALRNEIDETTKKQVEVFFELANKIAPIINFYKERRYYFNHPDTKFMSLHGPVIGWDVKEDIVFVYDSDNSRILSINLNNNSDKRVHTPGPFFEKYSFDTAMRGLMAAVKRQEEVEDICQVKLTEKKSELNKFI